MSRIGIIGAGVVGQATGMGLSHFGHNVIFCDINPGVLEHLKTQGYQVASPEEIRRVKTDLTIISVSTPTVDGVIDLSYVEAASQTAAVILENTDDYHLIVVRSTLPPGTTESQILPYLEQWSGKVAGKDFGICYHPEYLREASSLDDFLMPWIIVFGADDYHAGQAFSEIYDPISRHSGASIIQTNLRTAEMVKYAHNLYNATKISFTNEIWSVCRQLNVDGDLAMSIVSKSAEAMWNPEYGIKGGFPYGGSCLPKDTVAFKTFAQERGIEMKLLQEVIRVNDSMAMSDNVLLIAAAA